MMTGGRKDFGFSAADMLTLRVYILYYCFHVQGGSNMTGTDLYVNKPHCAAAVRP